MDRPDARSRHSSAADAEEPSDDGGDSRDDREGAVWGDRLPSNQVALAIASREHVVVAELPPLYESVDSDGLDAFLRSAPGASVTFTHCGYEVTVTGRGKVELRPLEEL